MNQMTNDYHQSINMGPTVPNDDKAQENHLLAALPAGTRERIFPHLTPVALSCGDVLCGSGSALHDVYFPVDSIVTILYVMENGASAEISLVGNEGMVGMSALMGGAGPQSRAVVQSAGTAYRLSAGLLKQEFDKDSDLRALLLNSLQASITQMAQTAACYRHHSIEQQLSRWLLLSLDRLPGNCLKMTQERIAEMLGVRRESVNEAAGKLQTLGIIEYSRGHIAVLDRFRLEKLSCECYAVVKQESDRLQSCPETSQEH